MATTATEAPGVEYSTLTGEPLPPYDPEAAVRGFWGRTWDSIVAGAKKVGNWFSRLFRSIGRGLNRAWNWMWDNGTKAVKWIGTQARHLWRWGRRVVPTAARRVIAWPVRIVSSVIGSTAAVVVICATFVVLAGVSFMDWYAKRPHNWVVRQTQQDSSVPVDTRFPTTSHADRLRANREASAQRFADTEKARTFKYEVTRAVDGQRVLIDGPRQFANGTEQIDWQYLFGGESLTPQQIYTMALDESDFLMGAIVLAEPKTRHHMARTVFDIVKQVETAEPGISNSAKASASKELVSRWFGLSLCASEYERELDLFLKRDLTKQILPTLKEKLKDDRRKNVDGMIGWFVVPGFEGGFRDMFDALLQRYLPDAWAAVHPGEAGTMTVAGQVLPNN